MRKVTWILAAAAVAAVLVVGLLQASDDAPPAPPKEDFDAEAALTGLKGSPPSLAAIHAQANQLLAGDEFEKTLASLKGHPVVINKWGSWCGPCRAEFPIFQRVAAEKGKTVAFLGLNGKDNDDNAREFLEEFPVSYPSYSDPDELLARELDAPNAYPITVFVDREGKVEIALAKPYTSGAELKADIKRYLRA